MLHLEFDQAHYRLTYKSITIELLPKEFALLQFLYDHHGQSFSRGELLDHVWPMEEPVDRTVDDHIYRLRKKVKPLDAFLSIKTVRGHGYALLVQSQRPTSVAKPSVQDHEITDHVYQMFKKFHRFGQGESMRVLAEHQDALGIEITPFYALYLRFVTGDFDYLVETEEVPLRERLYFLLNLYFFVQPDAEKVLVYVERALQNQVLPQDQHLELGLLNILTVYLKSGRVQQAVDRLAEARRWVIEGDLDGFRLALLIMEIHVYFQVGDAAQTDAKIGELEASLHETPYLREAGTFHVLKGLWLLDQGHKQDGEALIDNGIEVLKQSSFVPMLIFATYILFDFLEQGIIDEPVLRKKYTKIWQDLARQYRFDSLREKLERIFSQHL